MKGVGQTVKPGLADEVDHLKAGPGYVEIGPNHRFEGESGPVSARAQADNRDACLAASNCAGGDDILRVAGSDKNNIAVICRTFPKSSIKRCQSGVPSKTVIGIAARVGIDIV